MTIRNTDQASKSIHFKPLQLCTLSCNMDIKSDED